LSPIAYSSYGSTVWYSSAFVADSMIYRSSAAPASGAPTSAPTSPEIAAQISREPSPDASIPAPVAKDWRNSPETPLTN
jgi:hypothetical protein